MWGPDFNTKSLKVAKNKCSKWVYRKWILEYIKSNETYLLFGQNSQKLLQCCVVHVEIEQSENFGHFGQIGSMSYSILGTLKSIFCIPTLSTFFGNFQAFCVEVRTSCLAEEKSPTKKGPRGSSLLAISHPSNQPNILISCAWGGYISQRLQAWLVHESRYCPFSCLCTTSTWSIIWEGARGGNINPWPCCLLGPPLE